MAQALQMKKGKRLPNIKEIKKNMDMTIVDAIVGDSMVKDVFEWDLLDKNETLP